jgi:formate dehydrogenase major subunit
MRDVSRRDFLKISGAAFAASSVAGLYRPSTGFAAEASETPALRIKGATETTSICCFCSVGCGSISSVVNGELINFEGDPDHPVNQGGMCSKGVSQFNVVNVYDPADGKMKPNPRRLTKPRYRAPGASEWEEVSWEWSIAEIAKRVKDLRDKTFEEKNANGVTVNRTSAIASLGGAALDNEENHVLSKFMRSLGLVYIEHQARL